MAQQEMYPAIVNSPLTELTAAIDAAVTTIAVSDASKLPAAPNLATIGDGELAETILYSGKAGNNLTGVTRGFQGTARSWVIASKVARNFTAYDLDSLVANLKDALYTAPATPVTITYGSQVITVPRDAPFNVLSFRGLTRINVLGRVGGMEGAITGKSFVSNATEAADTGNFSTGSQSYKLTASGTTATEHYARFNTANYGIKANTNYVALVDMKPNVGHARIVFSVMDSAANTQLTPTTGIATDATKFTTQYVKFNSGAAGVLLGAYMHLLTVADAQSFIPAATAENANFDSIRVYEVSQAEYDALAGMPTDQVASKYPYVDDMKSVNAVHVTKQGENLIPAFTEWPTRAAAATIIEPYVLSIAATAIYHESQVYIPAPPSTQYTINYDTTIPMTGEIQIVYTDANKTMIGSAAVLNSSTVLPYTFTTHASARFIRITISNGNTTSGTYVFTDLMLNLGATSKEFKQRADQSIYIPSVNAASNVDGSIADHTYLSDKGKLRITRRFKTIDLDGTLPWTFGYDYAGFKSVWINIPASAVNHSQTVIKYDGKVLSNFAGEPNAQTSADSSVLNSVSSSGFFISISDGDSGWGETYTPSPAEIQAYTYGWKMYDVATCASTGACTYNGTGTKGWAAISSWNGSAYLTVSSVTPVALAPNTKPYRLQYQLAASIDEPVYSEGSITLHEGANTLEIGTGVVVRERANPMTPANSPTAVYINDTAQPGSILKNRVDKLIGAFRNRERDLKWKIASNGYYGKEGYTMLLSEHDKSASYEVTYFSMDSIGIAPQTISGEYMPNIRETVDELAKRSANQNQRLTVLEQSTPTKAEPPWLPLVLMNGFTPANVSAYGTPAYRINAIGQLEFKGAVTGTTAGVTMAILPYKPARTHYFLPYAEDGTSTLILTRMNISPNGMVGHAGGAVGYIDLTGIIIPMTE